MSASSISQQYQPIFNSIASQQQKIQRDFQPMTAEGAIFKTFASLVPIVGGGSVAFYDRSCYNSLRDEATKLSADTCRVRTIVDDVQRFENDQIARCNLLRTHIANGTAQQITQAYIDSLPNDTMKLLFRSVIDKQSADRRRVAELEAQVTRSNSENVTLITENRRFQNIISQKNDEIGVANAEISRLGNICTALTNEKNGLQEQNATLTNEKTVLENENVALTNQNAQLNAKIAEIQLQFVQTMKQFEVQLAANNEKWLKNQEDVQRKFEIIDAKQKQTEFDLKFTRDELKKSQQELKELHDLIEEPVLVDEPALNSSN